jgi:hypothetical protein
MVTIIWLSGKVTWPMDEGGSTVTGSAMRKDAVNMKKVTNRKAKSTMGVMSNDGAPPFDGFFDIAIFFIEMNTILIFYKSYSKKLLKFFKNYFPLVWNSSMMVNPASSIA